MSTVNIENDQWNTSSCIALDTLQDALIQRGFGEYRKVQGVNLHMIGTGIAIIGTFLFLWISIDLVMDRLCARHIIFGD